jgi:hypothetical protein
MNSFEDLVSARKEWINGVLKPWCQNARRADLLKAEPDWLDIAGKVTPEKTLWLWAWSRFPELVHESLGIEETTQVEIGLNDERTYVGFPDSRKSLRGQLVIWGHDETTDRSAEIGPFSIDEIKFVRKCSDVD